MKIRLLFLKCILKEDPESMIYRFLQLQFEQPTNGDWASNCLKDLNYLQINLSMDEIKTISKQKFLNMLKVSINQRALEYLVKKQGRKGSEIIYTKIEMSEYLMPNNNSISIEDKRKIFEMRNEMVLIPANFTSSENIVKCFCGDDENMRHIYSCQTLNNIEEVIPYEMIFKDDIIPQYEVYKRFADNLKQREDIKNNEKLYHEESNTHAIQICDPLSSLLESNNGNK